MQSLRAYYPSFVVTLKGYSHEIREGCRWCYWIDLKFVRFRWTFIFKLKFIFQSNFFQNGVCLGAL
jgi:hypothetical protein